MYTQEEAEIVPVRQLQLGDRLIIPESAMTVPLEVVRIVDSPNSLYIAIGLDAGDGVTTRLLGRNSYVLRY